jgi:hypothetical protein
MAYPHSFIIKLKCDCSHFSWAFYFHVGGWQHLWFYKRRLQLRFYVCEWLIKVICITIWWAWKLLINFDHNITMRILITLKYMSLNEMLVSHCF